MVRLHHLPLIETIIDLFKNEDSEIVIFKTTDLKAVAKMIRQDFPIQFKEGVKFCIVEAAKANALSWWLPGILFSLQDHFCGKHPDEPNEDPATWGDREVNLLDLFSLTGLCESKSDVKRRVKEGSLSVNGQQIKTITIILNGIDIHVLGKGKLNWAFVQFWV